MDGLQHLGRAMALTVARRLVVFLRRPGSRSATSAGLGSWSAQSAYAAAPATAMSGSEEERYGILR